MVRKGRVGSSPTPGTMAIPALPPVRCTRIAPTPSGLLHPGNGASFVLAWKLARQAGAKVLLRIDDLDAERMRPAYMEDIFRTLEWLGITWDEGPQSPDELAVRWSQHLRIDRYRQVLDDLRRLGVLYGCGCSRPQLPTCSCRERRSSLDGPEVTWRLDLRAAVPVEARSWPGPDLSLSPGELMPHDPVLRQRNGMPAYQVASLADDLDMGVDLVVRGSDLLPSTACQLHMARLLDFSSFTEATFVHHGLLTDAHGHKLSKSQGAGSLQAMRAEGTAPSVVHALADRLLDDLLRAADRRIG